MSLYSSKNFVLREEESERYFKEIILPILKNKFDFNYREKPVAYFSAGLPGAGKSRAIDEWEKKHKDIIIIDADNLRKYHPHYEEIQKEFGDRASEISHVDAVRWVKLLKREAFESRANYVLDSSMRNPRSAEVEISQAQANNYRVEVTMIGVNLYEALEGVYDRYITQHENSPSDARFVNPQLIKEASKSIIDTVDTIDKMGVGHFKIMSRDNEVIYDNKERTSKRASSKYVSYIDIENWSRDKLERFKDSWNMLVARFESSNIGKNVLNNLKESYMDLKERLKADKTITIDEVYGDNGSLAYGDAKGEYSLKYVEADREWIRDFQKEKQEYAKDGDVAKNWNWNRITRVMSSWAAMINQKPKVVGLEINGEKAGLMLMVNKFNDISSGERVDSSFIWYLQTLPIEHFEKKGFSIDESGKINGLDIGIGKALYHEAIIESIRSGNSGRLMLHADPKGGDNLYNIYKYGFKMKEVDSEANRVSPLRLNDDRYFEVLKNGSSSGEDVRFEADSVKEGIVKKVLLKIEDRSELSVALREEISQKPNISY